MCEKEIETEDEFVEMLKNMTPQDFEKLIEELESIENKKAEF